MLKRLKSAATAGLIAASLIAAPVAAQDDVAAANRADAQCLALFLTIFGVDNPEIDAEAQMGGTVLIGYFLGKIEARSPGADLESLMSDALVNDLADEAASTAAVERCSAEAMSMAERMTKAGASMTEKGM
jgi:hypothetical protein